MTSSLGSLFLPLTFLFESLSKFPILLSLSVAYVVLCMIARRYAPKFISPLASLLASLHILALAGLSGVIAYIIVEELSTVLRPATIFSTLCDPGGSLWSSGALGLIQNLNMMLKIVEMHHTFWMSMSGRQDHVTPFQLYHNVIMLWIAWSQTGPDGSSVQWLPILLNCAMSLAIDVPLVVHVFMYLCMYQAYRGGRTPFYTTLPMLQFFQGVMTSCAILAVFAARFVHDFIDADRFRYWRCSGSWASFLIAASLALCYPLGYMTLHKPATDNWLAERGLGLFFSIGHNLRHEKEEKRE